MMLRIVRAAPRVGSTRSSSPQHAVYGPPLFRMTRTPSRTLCGDRDLRDAETGHLGARQPILISRNPHFEQRGDVVDGDFLYRAHRCGGLAPGFVTEGSAGAVAADAVDSEGLAAQYFTSTTNVR
jgi:hypothetical protein